MLNIKSDTPENHISNHPNELIVRGSHKRVIFLAVLMLIPCIGLFTDGLKNLLTLLREHYITSPLLLLVIYAGAIYLWIKVFDKKIKLIINEKGMWYGKTGFVQWTDLWYYYFKENRTSKAGRFYYLIFKIREAAEDHTVDITFFDKTYGQIQQAIKANAAKNRVNDLGFKTK